MSATRKKMFRSSMKDDIDCFYKYQAINPFSGERSNKWAEIAEKFMIHVCHDTSWHLTGRETMQGEDHFIHFLFLGR